MINKFDRAVPKDFSWQTAITKLPELDVAGFNEVLSQNQQQFDQVGLLSEKKPLVLNNEADLQLYQSYKADVDKGLNEVTQAYTQGPSKGQMAYKNYLNQIRKDWLPGGRADILNQRYTGYQTALKETDEFYRDDSSPVNKTLAKQNLQAQLKAPINFDPTTGKFNSISKPELYKNPDINKAIDEMLKEIKADGDTRFLGDENKSWWLQKISTETRPAERIRLAYQALSQQPEYSSQIDRDTQYRALNTDGKTYQEDFNKKQTTALTTLTSEAEKAKTDPNLTKDWQRQLRAEGYNVDVDGDFGVLTTKATEQYLAESKKAVDSNISGFNLTSQLRGDVDKSYQDYATRGAYEKRDIDLVFNQAMKARADIAGKREENKINRDRLTYEYKAGEQSQVLAVDGIAQQLPEIQKAYQSSKDLRDQVKTKLDKSLSSSKAFNGWDMSNVAAAYQKWEDVTGATEAEKKANYKLALNAGGNYTFTDDQVDLLYQEMNAPQGEGALKTSLETYNQAQNEVNRYVESQEIINSQYLDTEEGKSNLKKLDLFRQPNESDLELANRAANDPESFQKFDTKSLQFSNWFKSGKDQKDNFNPAVQFADQRQSDIKQQAKEGKNYNWGSLGTTEIYAGTKDATLKPIFDMTAQAIETGTGNNFTSFGAAGLRFKDNSGEPIDDAAVRKVGKIGVTKNESGDPILKVGVTVTKADGTSEDGYSEIALVPGAALTREVRSGMVNAYVAKVAAGEKVQAQGILDNIDAIDGRNGMREASIDLQVKDLNLKNTSNEGLLTVNPQTGKVVPISTLGWQSKNLSNKSSIQGRNYETYGINTPSGNYVADVVLDPKTGSKVLVPSLTGQTLFTSASGVQKNRLGKQILSAAQVEVTKNKQ